MGEFRRYLLVEQDEYLGQKIGDLLTALQSLGRDSPNMGGRHLARVCDSIVAEMRKILEARWPREEQAALRGIQRAAVALAKAVETGEQLPEVVAGVRSELEGLQGKLGTPVNDLAAGVGGGRPRPADQS